MYARRRHVGTQPREDQMREALEQAAAAAAGRRGSMPLAGT